MWFRAAVILPDFAGQKTQILKWTKPLSTTSLRGPANWSWFRGSSWGRRSCQRPPRRSKASWLMPVDARTADAWKVVLVFHLSENLTDSKNAFMQNPKIGSIFSELNFLSKGASASAVLVFQASWAQLISRICFWGFECKKWYLLFKTMFNSFE